MKNLSTPTSHAPDRGGSGKASRSRFRSVLLALGASAIVATVAQSAAPPANSTIGNQASATYTDASNTQRTATSNTVTTVVQQVASFTLTTDGQTKYGAPGGQVYFPHTLTNTGNGTDTFTLSSANNASGDNFDLASLTLYADANGDGVPDNSTAITSTGPLAAGASFKFVAVGTTPGAQTATQTAAITISAVGTATGTPAAQQNNTDTVTVTTNGVVNATKSISSNSGVAGSGPHTFTLSYNNTGNSTATAVTLTNVIPAGMTYVAGSARWSVTGTGVTLTDANDGSQGAAPDTIAYDFGQTVAGRVTAVIARVQPGESRTVTFQVNIAAAQPTGVISNTANYSYDPGTGTPVGPFPTNTTEFNVVQDAAVTITGQTVANAPQGSTVSFTNPVTNNGNGPDSFDITVANSTFPAGTTFQLFKTDGNTPLVDTNGNSTPDTGTLAKNGVYNMIVKAILPPGFAGTNVNYTAVVTATSHVDATVNDTANDVVTSVTGSTMDLTNNRSVTGGATSTDGLGLGPEATAIVTNSTNPNTTTRFTLFVNNTSVASETFNLAASTVSSFGSITLPAGWSVVFRDSSNAVVTNTGVIGANSSKTVFADVTVPASQAPGTTDLFFRALSPTSGATDRIHDAVTVGSVRNITVIPNNSGQIAAGGTVTYSHTITNNGNVLEGDGALSSVALTDTHNLPGWTSVIYYDVNGNGAVDSGDTVITNLSFVSAGAAGLAPGESVRVLVKVTAPPGAPINASDTATLTATTTNGTNTTSAPAPAVATDTSSVVSSDIQITKEQALDAAPLDGTPDTAYGLADITSGAFPGKAIRYRITVKNNGTAPATAITVSDTTPAFTTYTSQNPAAITGGSAPSVVTVPVNGAAGPLLFNIGTLNPGEQAVATFGVKIDQ